MDHFNGGTSSKAADLGGTVNHVRDGDTIEVDNVAIRLQGLHAPELDEVGGPEAATFMVDLVMDQELACDLTGERSYDRLIGVCYLKGRDIAAPEDRIGRARVFPKGCGRACGATW